MTLKAFTMPKWGIEMAEGTIAECHLAEGTTVAKGSVMVVVETDKIANEIEAEGDALIYRVMMGDGDILPVGALLAVIGDEGHTEQDVKLFVDNFKPVDSSFEPDTTPDAKASEATKEQAVAERVPEPEPAATRLPDDLNITAAARAYAERRGIDVDSIHPSTLRGRITLQDVEICERGERAVTSTQAVDISTDFGPADTIAALPGARRMAAHYGLDLSKVKGSGKNGRVLRVDVETAAQSTRGQSADTGYSDIPFTAMRRTVATRLTQSKQTIPHYYITMEIDMGRLLGLRERLKASGPNPVPSVNDFIIKAAAEALIKVPDVNINVLEDSIRKFTDAHISMAVSVDGGVFMPVVRHANQKSVFDIAASTKQLAEKARTGKLFPEDYKGGTFSISNLGMFGVESFTAVINPPEGAIMAIGSIQRLPREHNHGLWFADIMKCMMSCDHRAIDGALGARFLQAFKDELENPARLVERI